MRKLVSVLFIAGVFISLLSFSSFAEDEKITMTTFYPSPYGVYKELATDGLKIGATYAGVGNTPPTNGLVVEGNVGIGTQNPEAKLVVMDGNVGIGTEGPNAELDVNGIVRMAGFKMESGAGADKVLTADANGVGNWQDPTPVKSFPTKDCHVIRAYRESNPYAPPGYYIKALIKHTNDNWDGYGCIYCSLDPSSVGMSYNDLVQKCEDEPLYCCETTDRCRALPPKDP